MRSRVARIFGSLISLVARLSMVVYQLLIWQIFGSLVLFKFVKLRVTKQWVWVGPITERHCHVYEILIGERLSLSTSTCESDLTCARKRESARETILVRTYRIAYKFPRRRECTNIANQPRRHERHIDDVSVCARARAREREKENERFSFFFLFFFKHSSTLFIIRNTMEFVALWYAAGGACPRYFRGTSLLRFSLSFVIFTSYAVLTLL